MHCYNIHKIPVIIDSSSSLLIVVYGYCYSLQQCLVVATVVLLGKIDAYFKVASKKITNMLDGWIDGWMDGWMDG